ncbi:beta-Ala-His dipeptidase [Xylona heveae TC161]|uniref:Beta-Ala-His dipeptidase n=1 Tax=Xylona heveae (strain CBS 132557 / TC161) TaxID=1328760 RepID=A0A165FMB1_XYLHT|nr:beta-Ala-His dipeptidase [Xylona heveae TC161]KZF21150.1 beta-Ala-His dipeptidase [Xylona heveae TC161]
MDFPTWSVIDRTASPSPSVSLHEDTGLERLKNDTVVRRPRETSAVGGSPTLFHRVKHNKSILALVVSESYIYAGTQDGCILVWSLETYELIQSITAHRGSVLGLHVSGEGELLFSSGGDGIVNAWCTRSLRRLYSIYSVYDVGDVFCVAYSPTLKTIYMGAQNTSIQWYDLKQKDLRPPPTLQSHPSFRSHRFFDSKGPGGIPSPRPDARRPDTVRALGGQLLEIERQHIVQYAHFGYVYCMLLAKGLGNKETGEEDILISGGGDGTIKLWSLDAKAGGAITELVALENGDNSVLSLALDGTFLYGGLAEGDINIWDLDTRQLVRSVKAHRDDVHTLSVGWGIVFSAGATGFAKKFNQRYECLCRWQAHQGLVLASAVACYRGQRIYVTGGSDDCIAIWDVNDCDTYPIGSSKTSNEKLLGSLARLVSYRTVSSDTQYAGECRRGASYLRSLFKRFGAVTEMLTTEDHINPVVYARFKGKPSESAQRKKILFYGHYDVIAAANDHSKWIVDPFLMQGINGYLYGRGVSDNKGPVLAALYAAAELVSEQSLDSDIIFLIEGEEECGSRGFEGAIHKYKNLIGDIDWILLANSYWLDDDIPCLTYGLRGAIHATVQVESNQPDLHSGVDGSELMDEPLKDLVMLLATLTGRQGRINIPGFYDPVLPVTDAEIERYAAITEALLSRNPELGDPQSLTASLMSRWRDASLTIHRFKVSGPENSTVIPHRASVTLSLRLVPNQSTAQIRQDLISFLEDQFANLGTKNNLSIQVDHQAEPWLGDPENEIFRTLEAAIMEVWGPINGNRRGSVPLTKAFPKVHTPVTSPTGKSQPATSSTLTNGSDHSSVAVASPTNGGDDESTVYADKPRRPLYIREGGSIPSIRFLETEFNAPAAHLPCGQASDSAHLDNERLRLSNLYKSRDIFKKVFRELPRKQTR